MGERDADFDFIPKGGFIWSLLLQFGTHGWGECLDGLGNLKKDYSNKMSFDEKVWQKLTNRLPKSGGNMVLIDVFNSMNRDTSVIDLRYGSISFR
jgi:hypothetical protein